MKQHLSSLQPLTCATGTLFASQCDSNPIWIVQELAVLPRDGKGLFLTAPNSSLPWAMRPIKLIHPYYIPLTDTRILASPAAGLALQGGLISGASMQQSEGLLRDAGALQPLKYIPLGKCCPSPASFQGRSCDGDGDDGAGKDWGENRS